MSAAPIHLAGERLMLDPAGALYWPAEGLLAVSDLHLEKGSSFAMRGSLLPPWDSKVTLERLFVLMRRYKPRTVIALGDSFHDAGAAARLGEAERARLATMTSAAAFIWVHGNHDPAPPDGIAGAWTHVYAQGGLTFRHEPGAAGGEICGHLHPKAGIATRTGHVSRPCFVTNAGRIMMPAFGAYTGGLDVQSPAIHKLFPRGGRVFLLGKDRLFSFALGGPQRAASELQPGT